MTLGDLDFMAAMLGDPEVMRYYPKPCTRDEAEAWIRRQFERYRLDGFGRWLAAARNTGEPVGQVGLATQMVAGVEEREIGYIIHRAFWRQGFATEAALAVREYALCELRSRRVIALVRPENAPSQGVARQLGMTPAPELVMHADLEHLLFSVAAP
jgi:RimJ/RimL family protein N-acetyltransferase